MTDHLALFLRLHFRRELLAVDARWQRALCWALGHEWRTRPMCAPACVRCDVDMGKWVLEQDYEPEAEA